jgi:hypothetical protein
MSNRIFGLVGAAWVFLALPALTVWFAFHPAPWATLPFMADLTNPVERVGACVLYCPLLVLAAMLLHLKLRRPRA